MAEAGIGTVASGVAKGNADIIQVCISVPFEQVSGIYILIGFERFIKVSALFSLYF